MCEKHWASRDVFLDDPTLIFNGYQANFGVVEEGLFFFTHEADGCGSTMAFVAAAFLSLYTGKRYTESKQSSLECMGYCLDRSALKRCQAHCQYAFVREVTQIIMDRSHKAA
ncbi:MAG: hypothetical protein KJ630_00565 [Proteobacteria bacterium]|nr:hypothetical protein [Pseudomonadota bacterium]